MADTYEKDLAQKSSLTTSDFIRVVGSDNVSYKQLLSNVMQTGGMGERIISSGGWSSDNAKTAFENAYTTWANNTVHIGVIIAGSVAAYIAFKADARYGAVHFLSYGSALAQEYTRNIYGGTWGDIILLNEVTSVTVTASSGFTSNLVVRKNNKGVTINGWITASTAFGTSETTVATLDASGRPYSVVRGLAGVANAAYGVGDIAYVSVGTDGTIKITAKSGNTYKNAYFSLSYTTA